MSRITIRFRPDGAGFTYELRDPERRVIKAAWCAGAKRHAQGEARRERSSLRAGKAAA
jgi:hypothetical protein